MQQLGYSPGVTTEFNISPPHPSDVESREEKLFPPAYKK